MQTKKKQANIAVDVVGKTLQEDIASRTPKNRSKVRLYPLEEINRTNNKNYSLPTIVFDPILEKANYLKSKMLYSSKEFKESFDKRYNKYLSKFDYKNMIIAGGVVSSVLMKEDNSNDIDMLCMVL